MHNVLSGLVVGICENVVCVYVGFGICLHGKLGHIRTNNAWRLDRGGRKRHNVYDRAERMLISYIWQNKRVSELHEAVGSYYKRKIKIRKKNGTLRMEIGQSCACLAGFNEWALSKRGEYTIENILY